VSRSAAPRGDSSAEFAAFRASWLLDDNARWRSHAATARAAWPEVPGGSVDVLVDAFERCLDDDDPGGAVEWSSAACEALAAQGDWGRVADIAGRAAEKAGPVAGLGDRLEVELDSLDARAALGDDSFHDGYRQLVLSPAGRSREQARIHARWATALARRSRPEEAAEHFRVAADLWQTLGGAEDEIAEAVISEDVVAQQFEVGRRLDHPGRVAVAELRGRDATAAVIADRREAEGLASWLDDRPYDARRALTVSFSIHRRAGHLGGAVRLAERLQRLFDLTDEPEHALVWALRTGRGETSRKLASKLPWATALSRLDVHGPPWESAAAFEVIAGLGADASDEQAAEIVDALLDAAADRTSLTRQGYERGGCARRALAALLCALPDGKFDAAREEVVFETQNTPFPPRDTVLGRVPRAVGRGGASRPGGIPLGGHHRRSGRVRRQSIRRGAGARAARSGADRTGSA